MLVCSLLTALIFLTLCRGHIARLYSSNLSPGISLSAAGNFFDISQSYQQSQEKFREANTPVNSSFLPKLSSSSPFAKFSSIASTTRRDLSDGSHTDYDYYEESDSSDQVIFFDYSNDDDTSTGWESFQGDFNTTDPTLFYKGKVL